MVLRVACRFISKWVSDIVMLLDRFITMNARAQHTFAWLIILDEPLVVEWLASFTVLAFRIHTALAHITSRVSTTASDLMSGTHAFRHDFQISNGNVVLKSINTICSTEVHRRQ